MHHSSHTVCEEESRLDCETQRKEVNYMPAKKKVAKRKPAKRRKVAKRKVAKRKPAKKRKAAKRRK